MTKVAAMPIYGKNFKKSSSPQGSHTPFLGMGPGPLELGKIASF